MGKVIPFLEFDRYFRASRNKPDFYSGTILDTNVLISLTYEVKADHEEVLEFFASLDQYDLQYYTTVTTRSEFLDFHRRLIMTENLLSAAQRDSEWKLSERERAEIKTKEGLLRSRQSRKPGSDPVFTDTDLKEIKRVFSAGAFSGHHGWIKLCDAFLKDRLEQIEGELTDRGVTYISQHEPAQKELFTSRIDWPEARKLAEQTCLGTSDAMLLNAFQCSRFPFIISADFDVGYAVLSSPSLKDVVMPDERAKLYKGYHFPKL